MITIICLVLFFNENIIDSIHSVLDQDYKNWELFIAYDKNNIQIMNSILQLQKCNKFYFFEFDKIDKSSILNYLVQESTNEWIAILDTTCIWKRDKLLQQLFIASGNYYDVIGTNLCTDNESACVKQILTKDISDVNFLEKNPLFSSSILIKRKLCKWTNNWLGSEEYELFIKLWLQNNKFYNLSQKYVKLNINAYKEHIGFDINIRNSMIQYYKQYIMY